MEFEREARVEYKFIADGEWNNDPLSAEQNRQRRGRLQ